MDFTDLWLTDLNRISVACGELFCPVDMIYILNGKFCRSFCDGDTGSLYSL